ncbi:hypothetical protein T4D_2787 [Trichinella pseudospiralis]|uniref:Uncharacterized protein n=1 Tax=Trichinella pseudospiralis TaxID=6337 RepID=A0A0V1F869_TRIPS|nr:hypothetical protein T4D_2787 [Trichinella pseudospiralis]
MLVRYIPKVECEFRYITYCLRKHRESFILYIVLQRHFYTRTSYSFVGAPAENVRHHMEGTSINGQLYEIFELKEPEFPFFFSIHGRGIDREFVQSKRRIPDSEMSNKLL